MHQYYLLVALHQPYALPNLWFHPSSNDCSKEENNYSKVATLHTSRKLLYRHVIAHNHHQAPSYRAFDDKAFMAVLMLLLTHVDSHSLSRANVLEHQRPHGLGIIRDAIRVMEQTCRPDEDSLGTSYPKILKRLVQIEAEAAEGACCVISTAHDAGEGEPRTESVKDDGLTIRIPYFGLM